MHIKTLCVLLLIIRVSSRHVPIPQELIGMLRALKVQYLVIPALPSVQTMWQQKFGFGALG